MPLLRSTFPGVGTCLCGDFRFGAFLSYLQNSLGISSNLGLDLGWMSRWWKWMDEWVISYHGPPKPTCLGVFMVNSLVLGGQNLYFSCFWGLMVLINRAVIGVITHWSYSNPLILTSNWTSKWLGLLVIWEDSTFFWPQKRLRKKNIKLNQGGAFRKVTILFFSGWTWSIFSFKFPQESHPRKLNISNPQTWRWKMIIPLEIT